MGLRKVSVWIIAGRRILFLISDNFKLPRRVRLSVCLGYLPFAVGFLVLGLFIPMLRNILLWPIMPRPWSYLSTSQIMTVMSKVDFGSEHVKKTVVQCTDTEEIDDSSLAVSVQTNDARQERDLEQWILARDFARSLPDHRAWRYEPFLPVLQPRERAKLLQLWRVLDAALRQRNVSYYVSGGTLLGVLRHRGFVPWDDDLDIHVYQEEEGGLISALVCLPAYRLLMQGKHHYRFFSRTATIVRTRRQRGEPSPSDTTVTRFPFIDIFIVANVKQMTFSLNRKESRGHAHPTSLILPLNKAMFEGAC